MPTTAKPLYGILTNIPITLAGLANSATVGRQSTIIDNNADLAVDAVVMFKTMTGTTPTAGNTIQLWAFGSLDGTNFTSGAGLVDAAFTPANITNPQLRLLESIIVTATNNQAYFSGPHSIQDAFRGSMPRKWGTFVLNNSGAALNGTPSNHSMQYNPIWYQSA